MAKDLEITLVRSVIGQNKTQKQTVKSIGLRKINQSVVCGDTPSLRGKLNKISHLVSVKEV